jgi:hypothetical protein
MGYSPNIKIIKKPEVVLDGVGKKMAVEKGSGG